ncbi:unnamed protein product [Acanthosepion pharaonis]|uniref:Transmembrane protein n=1 Tax=Acanthosepion pharaonis TaxID=158019 RepID=A0A812B2J0_ACAPH|nr:unnamed protein product [Sepia pharaonis]
MEIVFPHARPSRFSAPSLFSQHFFSHFALPLSFSLFFTYFADVLFTSIPFFYLSFSYFSSPLSSLLFLLFYFPLHLRPFLSFFVPHLFKFLIHFYTSLFSIPLFCSLLTFLAFLFPPASFFTSTVEPRITKKSLHELLQQRIAELTAEMTETSCCSHYSRLRESCLPLSTIVQYPLFEAGLAVLASNVPIKLFQFVETL